ncbi:MAG: DUF2333 family protein [Candidatus Parcubacteria bacterium]|nr:DUF2333 family protein [Candidatus Parcubacteria bacterium]
MLDSKKAQKVQGNRFRGLLGRTLHLLFSWKSISWPWRQIPGTLRWWRFSTDDWKYRAAASPVTILILLACFAGPLLTTYPAVWIGTYAYNYYSVIYPKDIPQDKDGKGKALTNTMIKVGETMMVNWQDNDLIISSSRTPLVGLDNPRNFQIGELMMYRRILEEMREHLTRKTANDYLDMHVVNAYNQFAYTSDKWIFKSTETMYTEGVTSLKKYLADVERGDARIYATTYNLDKLLEKIASGLAGTSQRLEDAGNRPGSIVVKEGSISQKLVPWNKIDDNYYEAQGNLYVTLQVLHAARIDFSEVLKAKQAVSQLDDIIRDIETNNAYLNNPLIVFNGKAGTLIPFHSGELASLMQTVSRNIDKLRLQITS